MRTLENSLIIVGVTGSIAAVETVKLIHALRRKGAEVQAVMSQAAGNIINPEALTYACNRPVITSITGLVEHVRYCGDDGKADLLLIAPCTANTISKIACGIDDTPVTTFATTAIGRNMPIIIVPAMHHAMFRHPGVVENLERLKRWGIVIIDPKIEEEKAKIAGTDDIILTCERALMGRPLRGKKVIITSGRCEEPVDDVRILTTRSSGKMGRELALAAYRLGAEVTILHRNFLPQVKNIRINSADSLRTAVSDEIKNGFDIYISAAAISDFSPVRREGKIPSGEAVSIDLHPLPKILDEVRGKNGVVVAFKLGEDSIPDAKKLLQNGISLAIANTAENLGSSEGRYRMMDAYGEMDTAGTKEDIAHQILNRLILYHIK